MLNSFTLCFAFDFGGISSVDGGVVMHISLVGSAVVDGVVVDNFVVGSLLFDELLAVFFV